MNEIPPVDPRAVQQAVTVMLCIALAVVFFAVIYFGVGS